MHAARQALVIASLLLCWALAAGCGSGARPPRIESPAAAGIEAIVAALRSDDPARAYALLSADLRSQVSFEEFSSRWSETVAERRERARALEQELRVAPSLGERARVTLAGGSAIYLTREGNAWRVESVLASPFRTGRPEEAVEMLAQALTTRDYDALLRVLTERRREAITHLVDDLTSSLARHLQTGVDTVELLGEDRAELRWDDGDIRYEVILHKEAGAWRVDDIHIRSVHSDASAAD